MKENSFFFVKSFPDKLYLQVPEIFPYEDQATIKFHFVNDNKTPPLPSPFIEPHPSPSPFIVPHLLFLPLLLIVKFRNRTEGEKRRQTLSENNYVCKHFPTSCCVSSLITALALVRENTINLKISYRETEKHFE